MIYIYVYIHTSDISYMTGSELGCYPLTGTHPRSEVDDCIKENTWNMWGEATRKWVSNHLN